MTRMRDEGGDALGATRRRRLDELLEAAVDLPVDARRDLLDRECAGDPLLRQELESLLDAYERTGLLDRPVIRWRGEGVDPAAVTLAPGTVVAHYEIQDRLGAGGMGVVYRAHDLRLERTVALKFAPLALGEDSQAKRRFLTEAKAAAALEHVNVCAIHEIGETEDGQPFIAMAYVQGESLRQLIARGPVPAPRALEIAIQLASALECAHARGVVHRDVKPANAMLGTDGIVKLVDFGVAKVVGSTLTRTGATPGTMAYMSPEQVRGEAVDHRADLWALGVVLYEMLAGRRPFEGDSDAATLHAITTTRPARLRAIRPDVPPPALDRIVARALAKERTKRFQSAHEMLTALRRAERAAGETPAERRRRTRRTLSLVAAAVVACILIAVPVWRRVAISRVLASIPRIEQLAADGRFVAAYALAEPAQRVLASDTTLQRLMEDIADHLTIVTVPPGASVWLRRVEDDGSLAPDSTLAGVTPLRELRVARTDYRVDVRKAGYAPVARIASSALNRAEASLGVAAGVTIEVMLRETARVPEEMVFVPGSRYTLVGREAPTRDTVSLADYVIDSYEVTNEAFKAFVAAGGYADVRYWRHRFVRDGQTLTRDEAMRLFVDRTGLPGPRGWSGQDFPAGVGRHPVTGVSWYEAAAFAEFAGKRLPTIFEWEKAARDGWYTHFEHLVMPWGLADPIRGTARRANFGGGGTEAVESHPSGISPYGAYNMAGNVEEWLANPTGDRRFVTGGAWDDPMYVFTNFLSVSGFHASPSLGFRCARSTEGAMNDNGGFDIAPGRETPEYRPADEATFRQLLLHYAYDRGPLDAQVVERITTQDWVRETISISGPWRDATRLYLYLPLRTARPLQTVVFVPGTNTFYAAPMADETERIMGAHVKAGRAVLAVLFKGMVGRPWDAGRTSPATSSVQYRQELVLHATELRRSLDYLETRADLDLAHLAYVGFSKGAGSWLPFAAVEPRFRSFVLIGGGLDERFVPTLPEANSINFASRIRGPTLLLNGRYDEENPWARHALPLWRLLPEPKRLAIVDGGHLPPAENRVPVINRWLDETVGRVR